MIIWSRRVSNPMWHYLCPYKKALIHSIKAFLYFGNNTIPKLSVISQKQLLTVRTQSPKFHTKVKF